MRPRPWLLCLGLLVFAPPIGSAEPAGAAARVDFERDILPLFYGHCYSCHSEKKAKPKADLRLDSADAIRESGVIVAGAPERSDLFKRISLPHADADVMPPLKGGSQPLDETQRAMLRRWIAEGAEFGAWRKFDHREPSRAEIATTTTAEVPDRFALAREVDRLVDAHQARAGGQPAPAAIDDQVFLRRVYLDVAGRIPTLDEARQFLADAAADKRGKLIDRLLHSEAYVSHTFNWWADQLRLITQLGGGLPWQYYDEWVKEAIRRRRPYDAIVAELVSSSGYLWDNGAVGFYLRDRGMPLDHMSNLTRVFLGTRMECAQCHDHPLEPITQKDFYQMTAFTYGVSALNSPAGYDSRWVRHWSEMQARQKAGNATTSEKNALSRLVAPLKRFTTDTDAELKFPANYAYNAALRKEKVEAQTLFGEELTAPSGNRREAFARWLVSPRNPRFARNLANRLWKRVMGLGLIEPVDALSPFSHGADPELLEFLTRTLVQLGFDDRKFLAMLLHTRAYQSAAVREEHRPDQAAVFRGPLLRRMSAEQLWDSLLVLLVEDLDERRSAVRYDKTIQSREYLAALNRMSADQLLERARVYADYLDGWRRTKAHKVEELAAALKRATAARDDGEMQRVRREQAALDAEDRRRRELVNSAGTYLAPETDPRWQGLDPSLVRASELDSPADFGHFLRKFGQSDRREIDASTSAPNITQSLALMNGAVTSLVLKETSLLGRQLRRCGERSERWQAVYLALLTRQPTAKDDEILRDLEAGSPAPAADVIWALLNSPEFFFIP